MQTRRIAVIQGHPDPLPRHYCHALADAYVRGARAAGHAVDVVEVARLEFSLARNREDLDQPLPPSLESVQRTLLQADHVVLIYPIWNGGMPALLRGFFEQTFRRSFTFPGSDAHRPLGITAYFTQRKALSGRTGRIIATMQMPAFVYRWYFHPHLDRNALSVSGVGPIRETAIGTVESANDGTRRRWLSKVEALGRRAH